MSDEPRALLVHPAAELLPLLDDEELAKLADDIKQNGLREPITLWRRDGETVLLDGRNRLRACELAGVPIQTRLYEGDDPVAFIVSANLRRRHLTYDQRVAAAARFVPYFAEEAARRKRQVHTQQRRDESGRFEPLRAPVPEADPDDRRARTQAAKSFGVSGRAVAQYIAVERADPELAERVLRDEVPLKRAERIVRERARVKQPPPPAPSVDGSVDLVLGDFRERMEELQDGSLDLIFTDPPYDAASAVLYEDLARIASRKLRPGGSLIAYAGHHALPEILSAMSRHLRYWWLLGVKHRHRYSSLAGKKVYVAWKPLVWFVRDHHAGAEFVFDLVDSDTPDKSWHEWSQSEAEAEYYLSKLCPPGGLVADPFAGAGTTLLAALRTGRRAVGFEIDPVRHAAGAQRLARHGWHGRNFIGAEIDPAGVAR